MKLNKDMLKKMPMPKARGKDPMLDLPAEEEGTEPSDEAAAEDVTDEAESGAPSPELEAMSDEDLLAEMARRGYDVSEPASMDNEAPMDEAKSAKVANASSKSPMGKSAY